MAIGGSQTMFETKRSQAKKTNVRPTMLLATIGFWILLNGYFLEEYIRIIQAQSGGIAKVTVAITQR